MQQNISIAMLATRFDHKWKGIAAKKLYRRHKKSPEFVLVLKNWKKNSNHVSKRCSAAIQFWILRKWSIPANVLSSDDGLIWQDGLLSHNFGFWSLAFHNDSYVELLHKRCPIFKLGCINLCQRNKVPKIRTELMQQSIFASHCLVFNKACKFSGAPMAKNPSWYVISMISEVEGVNSNCSISPVELFIFPTFLKRQRFFKSNERV